MIASEDEEGNESEETLTEEDPVIEEKEMELSLNSSSVEGLNSPRTI